MKLPKPEGCQFPVGGWERKDSLSPSEIIDYDSRSTVDLPLDTGSTPVCSTIDTESELNEFGFCAFCAAKKT